MRLKKSHTRDLFTYSVHAKYMTHLSSIASVQSRRSSWSCYSRLTLQPDHTRRIHGTTSCNICSLSSRLLALRKWRYYLISLTTTVGQNSSEEISTILRATFYQILAKYGRSLVVYFSALPFHRELVMKPFDLTWLVCSVFHSRDTRAYVSS